MKLEVGKKYETEIGEIHEVIHIVNNPRVTYPVITIVGENGSVETYTLDSIYDINAHSKGKNNLVREHIEPPRPCGYTKDQWEHIIDEDFLCGFSDISTEDAQNRREAGFLTYIDPGSHEPFTSSIAVNLYKYCAPIRRAGIRQPWFGGEQPVPDGTQILVKWRNGGTLRGFAQSFGWWHSGADEDVVEFVYLEAFDGR